MKANKIAVWFQIAIRGHRSSLKLGKGQKRRLCLVVGELNDLLPTELSVKCDFAFLQ
jgi:hypothetical protein